VALDGHRTEGDSRERDLQAPLVPRIPDGDTGVPVAKRRDDAEVRLVGLHRVGRGGVHEDEPVGSEHVDRTVDLIDRRHAGRKDDGFARVTERLEQLDIGQ
jgi:hypothetical protein